MKCERIGLRFSKKDADIASWFLMLKECSIEQSFAVKALLKAFFLNEKINGGTLRIREDASFEPTSIAVNEIGLYDDIIKIKEQGLKVASFTKDIIRASIYCGNEDIPPTYTELQLIHTKYKIQYLNRYLNYNSQEIAITHDDSRTVYFNKDNNNYNNQNISEHKRLENRDEYNTKLNKNSKMKIEKINEVNTNTNENEFFNENIDLDINKNIRMNNNNSYTSEESYDNKSMDKVSVSNKHIENKEKIIKKKRNPLLSQI